MYLRAITMRTSGTDMAMTPEAAMSFQMISNWVTRPCTPTGNVCEFGVAVRMRANRNSLHANVKMMMPAAMIPGAARGSRMRQNAIQRLGAEANGGSSHPG